ncbi:hypothetical protein KOW79_000626 [Hemibagrus wyckioides]|uniref:RRM domain-containing protein n=1 Tax=Hemibagrus wyckioides TaxID=337641 RepID=A0A9D3P755_9TELE|nr:hypothetical protein KOW79_000626 [Hemibagrus wyckioides]
MSPLKMVCDENSSRGYDYVHFESAEAVETAIRKFNGHKVFIAQFKSCEQYQATNKTTEKVDNSKQVHMSQVQKEEGHKKSCISLIRPKTTVTEAVPAVVTPVANPVNPLAAAVKPLPTAVKSVPS